MALISNKIQKRLRDKKECTESLKNSIKVYGCITSSTSELLKGQKTKAELVLTANDIVNKPLRSLPGTVKMALTSMALALILYTSLLHIGGDFGTSNSGAQAFSMFRLPASLQTFLGWHQPSSQSNSNNNKAGLFELKDVEKKITAAVELATDSVDRMGRMENNLHNSGIRVQQGTPMHGQLIASYPTDEALHHGRDGQVAVKASLQLSHSICYMNGFSDEKCVRFLSMHKLPPGNGEKDGLGDRCAAQHLASVICDANAKYRSMNGSCNHLAHPAWGQSLTGYKRLLTARYSDGIQEPRLYISGRPKNRKNLLPSARLVSSQLALNADLPDNVKTLALMQWTQFVEHDLSHTPVTKMYNNFERSIMCCDAKGHGLSPRHIHPACFPIDITHRDPFYTPKHISCMNYVRSVTTMRPDCSFGPAEQMNQVTHYLDGSMIYGSTDEKAQSLRLFSHGHLKYTPKDERAFLPSSSEPNKHCQLAPNSQVCYDSGDLRVNTHPHLTVMHTIWLREHNRIADKLETLNPHWDDEKLYQEARRIVVAEIQHITYNEWVPLVLGDSYIKNFGLSMKTSGFSTEFNENVDPSVSNSFATAALRFAHSLMEGNLRLVNEEREVKGTLQLRNHFNRPNILENPEHFDALLRGLVTQHSQKSDMTFTEDITSLLYRDSGTYGLDIISLDIQRGRDHGLPGYNDFRKRCGLPAVSDFDDLKNEIPQNIINKLKEMYAQVDDIDILIGGMAERPKEDSLLGPTFRCIIGEQFSRTRKGDRFFYDLKSQPSSFTADQLQEIRKATLSRVFCDNSDVSSMQPRIFYKPSTSNTLVSCRDSTIIPKLDLTAWAEN